MSIQLHRGVNISHWLSQSKVRGPERRDYFQKHHIEKLREHGFDHLRIPVDEEQMWTPDNRRESEAFDLLNRALDAMDQAGMPAIVDLHVLRKHHFLDDSPALFTDPREAEHFASLWSDLSDALITRRHDRVAYELLNEPVAHDNSDWNRVFRYPLSAIRAKEPHRTVLLGSNRFCSCDTFDSLDVPEDRNLILTFHYYKPLQLTHYRAQWCKQVRNYTGPVQYPGTPLREEDFSLVAEEDKTYFKKHNAHHDRDQMRQDLQKPLAVHQKTGLPLYCGEFGCYKLAPEDSRIRWYRDLVGIFDELNIGYAAWDWRGGFSVHDEQSNPTSILAPLLGR